MAERWSFDEAKQIYQKPFPELLYQAQTVHRQHFDPTDMQASTLLNIKTGRCPENCSYCPQSGHYDTGLKPEPLMSTEAVLAAAKAAKESGSTRFCVGAAWRGPNQPDLAKVCEMITEIKKLGGLETCATLGLLKEGQAEQLKVAGLDYYNHNIDTSPEHYSNIITTRCFEDRLDTLEKVRQANLKICCGGIIGMGETPDDRIQMLVVLANLAEPPESVPINRLLPIPGTPLADAAPVDPIEFVRTIALARILMPKSRVRLSAGREKMSDELQALCFLAGANSVFWGEKLLITPNPGPKKNQDLLERLGMKKAIT